MSSNMALFFLFAFLSVLGSSSPLVPRYLGDSNTYQTSTGQCSGIPSPIDNSAASVYAITLQQNDPGICQGLLDNLHGQCGEGITFWSCQASPQGQMNASFVAPTTCQGSSIQNAIWLASKPHANGIGCSWTPADAPSGTEGAATAIDAVMEGALEALNGS